MIWGRIRGGEETPERRMAMSRGWRDDENRQGKRPREMKLGKVEEEMGRGKGRKREVRKTEEGRNPAAGERKRRRDKKRTRKVRKTTCSTAQLEKEREK